MSNMQKALFLGGPKDGQWDVVNTELEYQFVSMPFEQHSYKLMHMEYSGARIPVYVHLSLSSQEIIQKLHEVAAKLVLDPMEQPSEQDNDMGMDAVERIADVLEAQFLLKVIHDPLFATRRQLIKDHLHEYLDTILGSEVQHSLDPMEINNQKDE